MSAYIPQIDDYEAAVAFLDERIGHGVKPGLERISGLLDTMGEPQRAYPVIHVAGTNGKTTTARLISDILGAHGLSVGTFTSPHLNTIQERFAVAGHALTEEEFTAAVNENAWFASAYEERSGEPVTYFELTTALAFAICAAAAVDVAVIEVGLGGRLDATNVVDATISVITGVAMDHMSYLGDSIAAIAAEKAAILKKAGTLVTAPLPAAAEGAVTARVAETGSRWFRFGTDFSLEDVVVAVGGWSCSIEGVYDRYEDVYLALHGRYQVDNLATAAATAEAFLDRGLDHPSLQAAAADVTAPGRLEVANRNPLVILDGAHNEEGFASLATALRDEFPALLWHLVIGGRGDRNIADLVRPLAGLLDKAWATQPDDAAAISAQAVSAGVADALGIPVELATTVPEAVARAMRAAGEHGGVVVAGSIYVAGEARRTLLGDSPPQSSGVHVRIEAEVDDEAGEDWE